MVPIILAAGCAAVALACIYAAHRLVTTGERIEHRISDLAATVEGSTHDGPGTDPELIHRIETAERRIESVADDITRRYRKLAQERRRAERAAGAYVTGEDDEDDSEDLEDPKLRAALQRQLFTTPATDDAATGGRRRLIPRNRR